VWVGVLGVVILYIYSLIGFAFLRDVFNPNSHVFCASLTQCFVSVIRYGLIGDYDEEVSSPFTLLTTSFLISSLCSTEFAFDCTCVVLFVPTLDHTSCRRHYVLRLSVRSSSVRLNL